MNIIVVGAGIAGLSTAWSLVKAGHSVTLLEQGATIPNPLAASGDHHRIIRRAYRASTGYGRARSPRPMTPGTSSGAISAKTISIPAASSASRANRATRPKSIARGWRPAAFRSSCSKPEAAVARWPFLEAGTFRYAYFSTEGGALHCRKIAAGLADWLRTHGANVYENSKVTTIDAEAGHVELESGETLQADRVVVAAGAWVLKLFPGTVGELKTYRTALAYVEPPADLKAAWEAAPVILDVGGKTDGYMIPPSPAAPA